MGMEHTFPIFFGFKGGKGVATSLRDFINDQLENWINLFGFCPYFNPINKNGIVRLLYGSHFVSRINFIY